MSNDVSVVETQHSSVKEESTSKATWMETSALPYHSASKSPSLLQLCVITEVCVDAPADH